MNTTPPAAMNMNHTCASSASKSRARIAALFLVSHFLLPVSLPAEETAPPSGNVAPKTSHTEDDGDRITIARGKFSDTAKPGTLKIEIPYRKLEIKGTSGDEIVIISELDQKGKARVDAEGFRRLDENGTFDLVEKDNVAAIQVIQQDHSADYPKFTIYVPRKTNLSIEKNNSGPNTDSMANIELEDIAGDVEIQASGGMDKGSINLENVTGAIVIETTRAKVEMEFKTNPAKPVSITAFGGTRVEVEFPPQAQANLTLRSLTGKIRTNFSPEKLRLKTSSYNPKDWEPGFTHEQTGLLNGGGVDIKISTHSGSITIKEDD